MKHNTEHTIRKAFSKAKRPAVLWSGGKDSTVLLDIARQIKPDIEVIHFKLPFLPNKYRHHHDVQEQTGLTVHDWLPQRVALTHGNDRIDVCETYDIGSGTLSVMRGTEPFDERRPWVCGLDWLNRPTSKTFSNFDVLLCGHKSVDIDPLTGVVPLNIDMKRLGALTEMWFPLREWTDEDVAEYILTNNIPYDKYRYDEKVVSRPDKHFNSDYVHACMRCVDKREGQFVRCPKLHADIENISEFVLHEQPRLDYCNVRAGLPDVRSVLQPQVVMADSQAGSVGCEWNPQGNATGGLSSPKDFKQ